MFKVLSLLSNILHPKALKTVSALQKSHTFCIMPWVHFHITQYGTVTPCCQTPWQQEQAFGNINSQSISDIWNNPKIKAFRKTMMNGKTDKRCESCYLREKSGFTSMRQITNQRYQHKYNLALGSVKTDYEVKVLPVYFDIRFSNVCNLRCRICGPWSSSSWFNDAVELGMVNKDASAITKSFTDTTLFFKEFSLLVDSLEELYFAGGEPLVIDEHYTILELLIAHKKTDVKLTYNTNFSSFKYKHHNIVELWKQFPNISIAASLDASEARGEFLRKNLKWTDVLENRRKLINELPHIEFIVSPTINIYNLLHLPDFHKDWVNENLIKVEDFIPTLLVKPKELSISILPEEFRSVARGKYTTHLQWIRSKPSVNEVKREHMIVQFENILKALDSYQEQESYDIFKKSCAAMDKVRNEKTLEVFPELKNLLDL